MESAGERIMLGTRVLMSACHIIAIINIKIFASVNTTVIGKNKKYPTTQLRCVTVPRTQSKIRRTAWWDLYQNNNEMATIFFLISFFCYKRFQVYRVWVGIETN